MDEKLTIENSFDIKYPLIAIGILVALLTLAFIFSTTGERGDNSVPTESAHVFPQVDIQAKSAYVYDIQAGKVIYAKNEDLRLPLASLTKVMTALVASDVSPLYTIITINEAAIRTDGDSGLIVGERWSLKDLLDFSLTTSSNDGMRAVALALGALSKSSATNDQIISDFVLKMNLKANELGLKNTYFSNETGLDEPLDSLKKKGGAYGTAKDMSALMEYVIKNKPELFGSTSDTVRALWSEDKNMHIAKNTNIIVNEVPGIMGSKTGFTETAGGNLTIAFDPELGRPIIITILGSTGDGRFYDMRELVSATMEYIKGK